MKKQILKFCSVGALAAFVHMSTVALLVPVGLHPLLANIFGFSIAFSVSYFGHRYWTFYHNELPQHATSVVRFWFVAVFGFVTNESLFFLFLNYTKLPYLVALFLVLLLVTPVTFLLGKLWAFR